MIKLYTLDIFIFQNVETGDWTECNVNVLDIDLEKR